MASVETEPLLYLDGEDHIKPGEDLTISDQGGRSTWLILQRNKTTSTTICLAAFSPPATILEGKGWKRAKGLAGLRTALCGTLYDPRTQIFDPRNRTTVPGS
jgi:hypothetical protein